MNRSENIWRVHTTESLERQTKHWKQFFGQQEVRKLVFEKRHMKIDVFGGLVWQLCVG